MFSIVLWFIVLSSYSPATLVIASTRQHWIPQEIHTLNLV